MKIIIETPYLINKRTQTLVEEKLQKLEKYKLKISQNEVYFRTDDGYNEESEICEIRLHIPGSDIFVANKGETPSKAFGKCLKSLKMQIIKEKSKLKSHHSDLRSMIDRVYNN